MSTFRAFVYACFALSIFVASPDRASAASRKPPRSAELRNLARDGGRLLGLASGRTIVHFSVLPNYSHESELVPLSILQKTPGNALYGKFLTGPEFDSYFGPSKAVVSSIIATLRSAGFSIDRVSENGDFIAASGPLAEAASFFKATFYQTIDSNNIVAYSDLGTAVLPQGWASQTKGVVGLDEFMHNHTLNDQRRATPGGNRHRDIVFSAVSPQGLEMANDMPVLHNYSGTYNQTIATLNAAVPKDSDVSYFLSYNGITRSYPTHILQTNGSTGTAQSDVTEATLDIETLEGTAPDGYIAIYTMPSLTNNNVVSGINYFVNANAKGNAAVLNMAFGECDNNDSYDAQIDNAFVSGVVKGQTFVSGTGDSGENHCPETPAASSEVLAVGGTSPDTQYGYAWQGGTAGQYGWVNGGGGTSTYYDKPNYQSSLGCGMRCIPDLALPADQSGGLSMYCTVCGSAYTPFGVGNGTSLASTLATASLGEVAQMQGKALGRVNGPLYTAYTGSAYAQGWIVDITAGNNGAQAKTGWDFVTGTGAPDWYTLGPQL